MDPLSLIGLTPKLIKVGYLVYKRLKDIKKLPADMIRIRDRLHLMLGIADEMEKHKDSGRVAFISAEDGKPTSIGRAIQLLVAVIEDCNLFTEKITEQTNLKKFWTANVEKVSSLNGRLDSVIVQFTAACNANGFGHWDKLYKLVKDIPEQLVSLKDDVDGLRKDIEELKIGQVQDQLHEQHRQTQTPAAPESDDEDDGPPWDVFLVYDDKHSYDCEKADEIRKKLNKDRFTVTSVEEFTLGMDIFRAFEEKLTQSSSSLLLLTDNFLKSRWCENRTSTALIYSLKNDETKAYNVIPLAYTGDIPPHLQSFTPADMSKSAVFKNLKKTLRKLVEAKGVAEEQMMASVDKLAKDILNLPMPGSNEEDEDEERDVAAELHDETTR